MSPRFVKVAEYQGRGVVHFHAIIRLDGWTGDGSYAELPAPWSVDVLAAVITAASSAASVTADVERTAIGLVVGHTNETPLRPRVSGHLSDQVANSGTAVKRSGATVPIDPPVRFRHHD